MCKYFFIGIGGIGMSAIARYFMSCGHKVAGYDLHDSELISNLVKEGATVVFTDAITEIPTGFDKKDTVVIYTPAVPDNHRQLVYFKNQGNTVIKRSQALRIITKDRKALCVAGTHGKTTTSTLLAHIMYYSHLGCNAFLGGVSRNYDNNILISSSSPFVVVEADEFDRSFHRLSPYMSIITSDDPDHLDIYGTEEAYRESFEYYTSLIANKGALIIKKGLKIHPRLCRDNGEKVRCYTYSVGDDSSDFYADKIVVEKGRLFFNWHYSDISNNSKSCYIPVELGVPLMINVENAVAAMAMAYLNGVTLEELAYSVKSFKGVARRFDIVKAKGCVLIDDYAHHPKEIESSIKSVKLLYPHEPILGIFQPHLYSRTKDFYKDFAQSLSALQEVILLDIYPARELPIEGISSQMIVDEINYLKTNTKVCLLSKEKMLEYISNRKRKGVILMLGAGDIDRMVSKVKDILLS